MDSDIGNFEKKGTHRKISLFCCAVSDTKVF